MYISLDVSNQMGQRYWLNKSFYFASGSGKSYLAKMLRDLEVENGGSAPRIYSMDDYFMTEVEKVCCGLA